MASSGSQKQITFDLGQEALKKYYPHSLTQAYYDIRRFMESHGFEHRQSSVYVSLDKLTTLDVVSLTEQLAMALPWLSRCVNEIDVANIGAQHSLKKVLENASRPLSVELEGFLAQVEGDLLLASTVRHIRSPPALELSRLGQQILTVAVVILPNAGGGHGGEPLCPQQRHDDRP